MKTLLFCLALALVFVPVAGASASDNPAAFSDPAGDVTGSTPDVTNTVVANTAAGGIGFLVQFANRTALASNEGVGVFLDADRNAATGDPQLAGIDHLILATAGGAVLARWNGSQFAIVSAPSLSSGWSNGVLISIAAADLGNTTGFNFVVFARAIDQSDTPGDIAGPYAYTLAPPEVDSFTVTFASTAPRAGKIFRLASVTVVTKTDERVAPHAYTCTATLGKKRIKGTGRGGCSWRLPKTARGKRLAVTVTITYGDSRASRRFTFTVK